MGKMKYNGQDYLSAGEAQTMQGATSVLDGMEGLVPQPLAGEEGKVLYGDGTWKTPTGGASAINDLTDVNIATPSNGQVLKYNSTSSKWENSNETGGTTVVPNPVGTPTDILDTIEIDGDIYEIQGGGGSGTNLILNAAKYSTDEKVIGVWVDNKPLYEKTISIAPFPNTGTSVNFAHGIANVEHIWVAGGWAENNVNGFTNQLIFTSSSYQWYVGADKTNVTVWVSGDRSIYDKCYAILHYTKTTDTAGSGGYQAYGFSPVIYSTEEREIGVWTDNKPLYAKTYNTTNATVGEVVTVADLTSLNIDNVIRIEGFFNRLISNNNDNLIYDFNMYQNNTVYGWARVSRYNTLQYWIELGSGNSTSKQSITIYYTKTTDVAGSGSYNTLGVPTVHYSTDEQVIGTYFGKPLYQKSFDGLSVNINNGSWYNITNIPNGKDLIDIKIWGEFSEYYMLIPCQAHIDSTNNGLLEVLFTGLNATRTVKRLAVQYTKTTD